MDRQGVEVYRTKYNKTEAEGADLCYAELAGADLSYAFLKGAYLTNADLRGANLRGAILKGADLSHADLTGANIRGAVLLRANLTGTKGIVSISGLGHEKRTGYIVGGETPMIRLGCFWGTEKEAKKAIAEKYGPRSTYWKAIKAGLELVNEKL